MGGLFQDQDLLDFVKLYLESLSSLPISADLRLPLFLLTHLTNDNDLISHIEILAYAENEQDKFMVGREVAEFKKKSELQYIESLLRIINIG